MPHSRAPLAAQRRMGGVTRRNADTRIVIVRATGTAGQSSAKRSSKFVSFLTFWDHNKKFRLVKDGQSQEGKFAADGIHLAPRGQYQLYKSFAVCKCESCRAREATEELTKRNKRGWFPLSISDGNHYFKYGRRPAARQVQANHLSFCSV